MKLVVSEIFYSIQGEGPHVGKPAVFLRLNGCNLNCEWCDSKYTWSNQYLNSKFQTCLPDRQAISNNQIIKKIRSYPCRHLVITGGEPLLQQEPLKPLLEKLKGYFIELETNGSIPLKIGKYIEQINCSPKLSSSGNKAYSLRIRPGKKVIYKFVVSANARSLDCAPPAACLPARQGRAGRDDRSRLPELEEIKRFTKKNKIPRSAVWLMPEGVKREVILKRSKALIEICKKEGYNFSPRLHIMLWENKRGV